MSLDDQRKKRHFPAFLRKATVLAIKFSLTCFLLFAFLFADTGWTISWRLDSVVKSLVAALLDPATGRMVFIVCGVNFIIFLAIRSRCISQLLSPANADFWLLSALLICCASYFFESAPSSQALVLLFSVAIGQIVAAGGNTFKNEHEYYSLIIYAFISLLVLASLISLAPMPFNEFQYHGHARLSGPWDSPNTFGLLLGTGMVLAMGSFIGISGPGNTDGKWHTRGGIIFCLCAFTALSDGWLHAYSRGAWLGTLIGLAYIAPKLWPKILQIEAMQSGAEKSQTLTFTKNWLPVCVILVSLTVLCFWWLFTHPGWFLADRVFSVWNQNDFSWRNRVDAWKGALEIIAEHPWLGAGWDQSELLYKSYYLAPKNIVAGAINTNDYLMIGTAFGIPALSCVGIYFSQVFGKSDFSERNMKRGMPRNAGSDPAWTKVICHGGAIVLLVGFWFDGGLFDLPTATTFWILFELGRGSLRQS